jgi:hypothetical protein
VGPFPPPPPPVEVEVIVPSQRKNAIQAPEAGLSDLDTEDSPRNWPSQAVGPPVETITSRIRSSLESLETQQQSTRLEPTEALVERLAQSADENKQLSSTERVKSKEQADARLQSTSTAAELRSKLNRKSTKRKVKSPSGVKKEPAENGVSKLLQSRASLTVPDLEYGERLPAFASIPMTFKSTEAKAEPAVAETIPYSSLPLPSLYNDQSSGLKKSKDQFEEWLAKLVDQQSLQNEERELSESVRIVDKLTEELDAEFAEMHWRETAIYRQKTAPERVERRGTVEKPARRVATMSIGKESDEARQLETIKVKHTLIEPVDTTYLANDVVETKPQIPESTPEIVGAHEELSPNTFARVFGDQNEIAEETGPVETTGGNNMDMYSAVLKANLNLELMEQELSTEMAPSANEEKIQSEDFSDWTLDLRHESDSSVFHSQPISSESELGNSIRYTSEGYTVAAPYDNLHHNLAKNISLSKQVSQHLESVSSKSVCRLMLHSLWMATCSSKYPPQDIEHIRRKAAVFFEEKPAFRKREWNAATEWANFVSAISKAVYHTPNSDGFGESRKKSLIRKTVKDVFDLVKTLRGEKVALAMIVLLWQVKLAERKDQFQLLVGHILDGMDQDDKNIDHHRLHAIEYILRTYDGMDWTAVLPQARSRSHQSDSQKPIFFAPKESGAADPRMFPTQKRDKLRAVITHLAAEAALNSQASDNANYRMCYRCFLMLRMLHAHSWGDEMKIVVRSMVWSGLIRPFLTGVGVSSSRIEAILWAVENVEGKQVAERIDSIMVSWQLKLRDQRRDGFVFDEDSDTVDDVDGSPDAESQAWFGMTKDSTQVSNRFVKYSHSAYGLVEWITADTDDVAPNVTLGKTVFSDLDSWKMVERRYNMNQTKWKQFQDTLQYYTLPFKPTPEDVELMIRRVAV